MAQHDSREHDQRIPAGQTGSDSVTSSRRRLLKGSAMALPAVLTLRSGGLSAVSLTCSERAGAGPFGGPETTASCLASEAP